VRAIEGLDPGIHAYDPFDHSLVYTHGPLALARASSALFGAPAAALEAPALILLRASFWKTRFKYGERGYRYVLLEAGHVAHGLVLAAGACGLGSCTIGSFDDDTLNGVCAADGVSEAVVYAVALGLPQ